MMGGVEVGVLHLLVLLEQAGTMKVGAEVALEDLLGPLVAMVVELHELLELEYPVLAAVEERDHGLEVVVGLKVLDSQQKEEAHQTSALLPYPHLGQAFLAGEAGQADQD